MAIHLTRIKKSTPAYQLTRAQKRRLGWFAHAVAHRVLARQAGDMDLPETWIAVAEPLGCRMCPKHEPGGIGGEYRACGEGMGVIVYNTAMTPPAQARVIVHELAHHLLMTLLPGDLFGDWYRAGYDDDPADLRHQICIMVEKICFKKSKRTK